LAEDDAFTTCAASVAQPGVTQPPRTEMVVPKVGRIGGDTSAASPGVMAMVPRAAFEPLSSAVGGGCPGGQAAPILDVGLDGDQ
jgi:hypothetical protein